jgi:tetratricopeptide (TPR) repeat protein
MIIRDEAAMLPGFLASVAGLWDELVVADTGSTDGSAALVRAAGGQVVDFPWVDDFAAARNASLGAATGRWILFLDADERVDAELAAAVRALVAGDDRAGAATVVMRNALPGGGHSEARLLRLFRNSPGIRFRHRVHEDVADDVAAFLGTRRLAMRHLPGGVDHLGYARAVASSRQKKDRDLRLLRLALADDPHDLYCRFKLLELARFWDDRALWEAEVGAAREAFESAPAAMLADRAWAGDCAALIAQLLPGSPREALEWLERQAARAPAGPAWHLRHGALLEACDRLADAEQAYARCLQLTGDPTQGTSIGQGTRPLLGLCRLAARRGRLDHASELARRAAGLDPLDGEALLAVAAFAPLPEATTFLMAHARRGDDVAVAAAQALLSVGAPEAALAVLGERPDTPRRALGAAFVALVIGAELDVAIDLDGAAADAEMRAWLQALWNAPRAGLRDDFVERAGALADAFPWLATWIAGRMPAPVSPSPR